MSFYPGRVLSVLALPLALALGGCSKDVKDKLKEAAGTMHFSGTVVRAGTTTPIEGATVNLIPLVDAEAVKALIEYRKIPDGKGGQKDIVRIKFAAVQAYVDSHGDVVKATTDAQGKWTTDAATNLYLVYTFGPGGTPGSNGQAYGPHFWGIDAETGELTLDSLIGKDLKLDQKNDKIQLAGGPVPPPAPPAATPLPDTTVTPPAAPATVQEVQPEPKAGDTLPVGNLIPPTPSAFWKEVKLTYEGGTIGTGSALETKTAPLPEGQRYLELTAELAASQTEPVYLVIQKGFDSTYVSDCTGTVSAATTRVYPVNVNGTSISYQLVPPGPFYKMYFAKTATQENEGEAPKSPVDASEVLTVGERTCDNAVPARPFLATLSWDKQSDIDLYVSKFEAAKVKAAKTGDEIGDALIEQVYYSNRNGQTVSLDVDNVYAYGPENNGEDASVTDISKYCYLVRVNYYSGSSDTGVNANVDVTMVTTENGKKVVKQMPTSVKLDKSGDWKTIGAFGPSECTKLLNPPSTPTNVTDYPSDASSCTISESCALKGDEPGKYKATITLGKTDYAAGEPIEVKYSGMPGLSGDWITIVPKGQTDASWCTWNWSSGTEGTQWYGAVPPGDYEVRTYYGWSGGQCEVIGRLPFTVKP